MGYSRVVVAVLATGIACGGVVAGARLARAQDLPASPRRTAAWNCRNCRHIRTR
ncbi:hypothetical protein RAA17_00880 [Komagataeibacter rhaeticus]|nr:hypothetical protein [Komagataeibacter rhaeticus]